MGNSVASAKKYTAQAFQGITLMDTVSATAGLAAAFMIPNYVIKSATPGAPTTMEKWQKLGVSAVAAVAVGFIMKTQGASEGKAAIIGGAAGVAAQFLNTFTSFPRIAPSTAPIKSMPIASPNVAPGRYPAPSYSAEFDNVRMD